MTWYVFFFFFSSRRRHTRFDCDWSSDVCSSDLGTPALAQVESTQQPTTAAPNISQEQAPAIPSIQDVRSPLNTISNRPRATTGAQTGAAQGAGQTALTPGARTAFP